LLHRDLSRVGLVKNGKLPAAHATLASLGLKAPVKLMVVGTPAAALRAIDERSDAHAAQELADQLGVFAQHS
jgi:hypothetical protein